MLIVLSGLPGAGKTTIAKLLCRKLNATNLRIDNIEQAIVSSLHIQNELGKVGYVVAQEIASGNLALGGCVVVDAVNPLTVVRDAWRAIARSAASAIVEVGIVCSDKGEHRRRVESRKADIAGHTLPTWDEVQRREFEPWSSECLVIDSARVSAEDAASKILESIRLR